MVKLLSCTSHDMKYLNENVSTEDETINLDRMSLNRRLTAIGCQNGWLGVFFIDINKNGN